MTEEIKRIDIKEFREKGFLHEANRLFFHPLGLALEVIVNEETGEETLGGVWDYRDDPEGMFFGEDLLSDKHIASVNKLRESKIEARINEGDFSVLPDGVQIPSSGKITDPDSITVRFTLAQVTQLMESQRMLDALIGAGVDNWDGYDIAMEMLDA